ncbi:hypothetical protein P8452_73426 [Trifolium repens]|nr:hypothetical protein P8452_73426 [Trifolium repens]
MTRSIILCNNFRLDILCNNFRLDILLVYVVSAESKEYFDEIDKKRKAPNCSNISYIADEFKPADESRAIVLAICLYL